ncbi:3-isopropylmalate dehydratase small subunit [Natronococcus sp. A-GB7]|uniref:3-isopropylmalate dehydratase small subunit n=1 Tax=Natronococcus sp. A-GB7 TaxID=3037649 RepID=UPI00242039C0|nr:3-isopropylmalate dehydratase small subunit [Natronococcus sp. A-GB7]MDG5820220.1 3-isopropylmalate dehydratase small subunit [Natronococcus sp. A-GB7]
MGRAHVFGDDIDTDQIIPAQHTTSSEPDHLATHAMAGIDTSFSDRFEEGDIVVAGTNFGCGSSREHAAIALQAVGAEAVVAESFARIFYRNAINIGLPVLHVPTVLDHVDADDELSIDVEDGVVTNTSTDDILVAESLPPFVRHILDSGGLIEYGRSNGHRSQ